MPGSSRFRNAALIYNPLSGGFFWRDSKRKIDRAVELLAAYGIGATLLSTTGPGSATEIAREQIAANRDLVIVWGGDGSINEVVNGMVGSAVPLAVLPGGTGNVLAKELGLPRDPLRAAAYVLQGEVRRIALGRAGQRYFVVAAGVGADANILYHLNPQSKLRLGILSYWLEALHQLFEYDFPEFTVETDGEELAASFLVVSRTKHYAGPVQITRRADLFGPDFEVCAFPRRSRLRYLLYFFAQALGRLEYFPEVQFRRAKHVRAAPDGKRIYVEVDGEFLGPLPMEFSIVPDALSLLVPSPPRS